MIYTENNKLIGMMNSGSEKRKESSSGREERKELKYIGVRRRSWGKWVCEIREPKKKRRIWLGSYDNPQMAARAYDAAALCLKGPSAVLNYPEAAHTLPRPLSSHSKDIQSAASLAARSFDEHKLLLFSHHSLHSEPHSSEPRSSEAHSSEAHSSEAHKEEDERKNGEQIDRMQAIGEVGGEGDWEVESPNMMVSMAEALLLTPPRIQQYDDEDEAVEPLYSLWNY